MEIPVDFQNEYIRHFCSRHCRKGSYDSGIHSRPFSVACYQVMLPGLQMVGLSPCRPQSLPDCQSSAAGVLPIELRAFAPVVVVVLASCPLVLAGNEVSPALIG